MSVNEVAYPRTDKEWQAQNDAETLARAEVIKSDDSRHSAAQVAAAKLAENERQEANALQKVAGKKRSSTPSSAGRPAPRGTGGTANGKRSMGTNSKHNVFKKI